jgi:histidyl-tRNA synthetase
MIKLPRGTQDYAGENYEKLNYLKTVVEDLFKKYHGSFIETPVFERTDVLMNKYGEDEKLIYNIEAENVQDDDECISRDKNEIAQEKISLRYDHTVPLVRYCLLNAINKMRRCCFGKVYRRERTTKSQIRLREFYQADFDYVGNFDELVPELEIFCMIQELFKTLSINNYQIVYNYRQNLDFYTSESKIDPKMFSTVCSSVDKLDKKDREEIRNELIEKGLVIDQINKLYELLFSETPVMSPLVKDLDIKFNKYIDSIKILDKSKIKLVTTLARGSDYYTGIIFEVKLIDSDIISSVSGGGRYDKLIPSYKNTKNDEKDNTPSEKTKKSKSLAKKSKSLDESLDNPSVNPLDKGEKTKKGEKTCKSFKDSEFPMIGFSFGVDRLLPLVKLPESKKKTIKIWVSTIGKIPDPVSTKLYLIGKMSTKGYGVFYNLSNRKFKKEIEDADENKCSFIIIIGENEWAQGKVTIRNMNERTQNVIDFDEIDKYFDTI